MLYRTVARIAKEKGYSIARLEKTAGIGNGSIRHWNKIPCKASITSVCRVAKVLGVTVDELVRGE